MIDSRRKDYKIITVATTDPEFNTYHEVSETEVSLDGRVRNVESGAVFALRDWEIVKVGLHFFRSHLPWRSDAPPRGQRLIPPPGLPRIKLYDLRHPAATIALGVGVSPKVVSEQLGHASAAFKLDIYAHVLPHMPDKAVAAVEAMLFGATA